tara:strand:- start:2051 stop:2572 length:522 start_codon:yes stop_codon:yes gene_type:complete
MKPVLMIHEVSDWMFTLPLHDYILTFDDGLYTQYLHFDKIKNIDTDKIFFISTGIVALPETKQSDVFIHCHEAHDKLFESGDLSHYMNWSQIQDIGNQPKCEIGAHSHMHIRHTGFNTVEDTKLMMKCFKDNNIKPTSFCYPYNDENPIYKSLLKQYGFNKFYGTDRIDIYDL